VLTKGRIAEQLAVGTSSGIAYHLAVDATLQPAAYHGIPFSMPMEGHQTFMAINALTEGADAVARSQTVGKRTVKATVAAGGAVVEGFAALGARLNALVGKR
jgi:hypothetical protein